MASRSPHRTGRQRLFVTSPARLPASRPTGCHRKKTASEFSDDLVFTNIEKKPRSLPVRARYEVPFRSPKSEWCVYCHRKLLRLRWHQNICSHSILQLNTVRHGENGCHHADNIFIIFYCVKTYFIWHKFHWNLFYRVQLIISQHCFRSWLELMQSRRKAITWTNDDTNLSCQYMASMGHNDLKHCKFNQHTKGTI